MCRLLGRRFFTISQNQEKEPWVQLMHFPWTQNEMSELKKAKLENGFYNIIDGERVSASNGLSVINPATGKHLATVPDVDRALLNKAISAARNAFG
jgi:hypothetical protein